MKYSGCSFEEILKLHDCVLVLSWSDWTTEVISNRWHYSTRLNRSHDVIFINIPSGNEFLITKSSNNTSNKNFITITPPIFSSYDETLEFIYDFLINLNYHNPLIWLYNPKYENVKKFFNESFVIYHATEDYFDENYFPDSTTIRNSIVRIAKMVNLWIFCTLGVKQSYQMYMSVDNYIYLPNGVDYKNFYSESISNINRSVAYHGAINDRLDFDLIEKVVQSCPDIQFNFYGTSSTSRSVWQRIIEKRNVHFFSNLNPTELKSKLKLDGLAWIPFIKSDYLSKVSIPLKYFESLALGLPVISIPLNQVTIHNPKYIFASNAQEFIVNIREYLDNCSDFHRNELKAIAAKMDYDMRFEDLLRYNYVVKNRSSHFALLIIDETWLNISAVRDHVVELHRTLGLIMVTIDASNIKRISDNYEIFDVVIIHFSVRFNLIMGKNMEDFLSKFTKYKILFIQDDYDNPDLALQQIDYFKIDLVLTSTPEHLINKVYPVHKMGKTKIRTVLSGYVTEDMKSLRRFWNPLSDRNYSVVYRGRELPLRYGKLGQLKKNIGDSFARKLDLMNLPHDISSDSSKRIFANWYSFLASGKATLITESGSSIIDWDGALSFQEEIHGKDSLSTELLEKLELKNPWNCIPPKAFEAISVGTVLIGFTGYYSSILLDGEHYIALELDYSNLDRILDTLSDPIILEEFRDKSFNEIIMNSKFSYEELAQIIMNEIELNKRDQVIPKEIYYAQSNRNTWNLTISSPHFQTRISYKHSNTYKIPFLISKNNAIIVIKSWLKFRKNLLSFRFSLFRLLILFKPTRLILKIVGGNSVKMSRYLSTIN